MPWDSIENFAVEAVKNPNACYEYGGEAVEWNGFQVFPHGRWINVRKADRSYKAVFYGSS